MRGVGGEEKTSVSISNSCSATLKDALLELSRDLLRMASQEKDLHRTHVT